MNLKVLFQEVILNCKSGLFQNQRHKRYQNWGRQYLNTPHT